MSLTKKIRGFNVPWVGFLDSDIVVTYNNLSIAFIGDTEASGFMRHLPVDQESLFHDASLVTRWFGGMSLNAAGLTTMQHAVYWDAVIVLGLIPNIVFIVPDSEELQHALLLGRGMLMELHPEWFDKYKVSGWHNHVEAEQAFVTPAPVLHWVTHNF